MSLISWPYRWLALALLAFALSAFGWVKGAEHVQAKWDAAIQQHTMQTATIRQRQAEATVKVVTQYVDRVRVVREKGDTIIERIPVYVPSDLPDLPGSVRVLHDAAATATLPDPARAADAPPIGTQDFAATVATNYQTCFEAAEQLTALQAWVLLSLSAQQDDEK